MHEVVVVGAGQLGSRHLQGLARLHGSVRLHMVDFSEQALELSRARVAETAGAAVADGIEIHRDVTSLPAVIDAAIIATTADRRLSALIDLLAYARVRYLLLEKVLFQQFSDYDIAARKMAEHGTLAWVNCPRRVYPVYGTVKSWLSGQRLEHMDVAGGAWGLGCNGIHFVDLFSFLGGDAPVRFDTAGLQPGTTPARRMGNVEYSGTLRAIAQAGDVALTMTSRLDSSLRHLITLRSADQHIVIDEGGGTLWRYHGQNELESLKFSVPFQSELTAEVVSSILAHKGCTLTTYAESAALHLGFLRALAIHSDGIGAQGCKVT